MITFKQFIEKARLARDRILRKQSPSYVKPVLLPEHNVYCNFPGEKTSYRMDAGNTSTLTQRHAHVFARPEGKGKQLYAVNVDGSGHDGSSGYELSTGQADFLRKKGFSIPESNILEQVEVERLSDESYSIIMLTED